MKRSLREGDAVIVDAASGRVTLVPPPHAEARVAAAEAARAYDGLRDAQALEQWLIQTEGESRGAALLSELVPRAVAGAMGWEPALAGFEPKASSTESAASNRYAFPCG